MSDETEEETDCIDELIRQLRADGYVEPAAKLHSLLHESVWTTGSELRGELGLAVLAFERSGPKVSPDLRRCLDAGIRFVRRTWPNIK